MRRSVRAAVAAAALLMAVGVLGFALAACGGSSAADAQAQAGLSGMPQPNGPMGDPGAMVAKQLDAIVRDGTITSEQRAAVVTAVEESMPGGSGGALQGAPSPGSQPSPGARPPDRGAMFTAALAALVEKGTITASQGKAIEAALTQSMPGAPPGAQPTTDGSST